MEDTTNQPSMADASLYNGQPTDTGLSCPSAGLTSCTPSTSDDIRNGVSVENVPIGNKQWFVLRISYGHILKAKTYVEAKGLECYVPLRYKEVRKQSKKRIITKPLLPSLIFVHASAEQVETLLHDNKVEANESRSLLSYYFDHTIHRQDNPKHNPPLTIRDEAMNNFIRLTSIKNPHIISIHSVC
ncbi:transcription termination/antitermination NusG family protein [Prevotella merdae]|uniref:transcription termination/antitermination NusG family protein n=1 Tax=Prevotella merdae TaxID=2079531 RepID=UPI003F7F42D9